MDDLAGVQRQRWPHETANQSQDHHRKHARSYAKAKVWQIEKACRLGAVSSESVIGRRDPERFSTIGIKTLVAGKGMEET